MNKYGKSRNERTPFIQKLPGKSMIVDRSGLITGLIRLREWKNLQCVKLQGISLFPLG